MGFGWTVLTLALTVACVLLSLILLVLRRRMREPAYTPQAVTKAEEKADVGYTYADLLKDIEAGIPTDDILLKCGGVFPEPPEDVVKQEEAPKSADRDAERQSWFAKIAATTPKLKIVPPPPIGMPVASIKGWVIQCRCKGGNIYSYLYPPYARTTGLKQCESCHGKGYVIMTGA